jgi:hypothetical protein
VGAEFLGMARIPVKDIIGGQTLDQWLDLVDKMGAPVGCIDKSTKKTRQARLHVTITFRPVGTKVGGGLGCRSACHGAACHESARHGCCWCHE